MEETRAALAQIVESPSAPPKMLAVKPKDANVAAAPKEKRKRYVSGRQGMCKVA